MKPIKSNKYRKHDQEGTAGPSKTSNSRRGTDEKLKKTERHKDLLINNDLAPAYRTDTQETQDAVAGKSVRPPSPSSKRYSGGQYQNWADTVVLESPTVPVELLDGTSRARVGVENNFIEFNRSPSEYAGKSLDDLSLTMARLTMPGKDNESDAGYSTDHNTATDLDVVEAKAKAKAKAFIEKQFDASDLRSHMFWPQSLVDGDTNTLRKAVFARQWDSRCAIAFMDRKNLEQRTVDALSKLALSLDKHIFDASLIDPEKDHYLFDKFMPHHFRQEQHQGWHVLAPTLQQIQKDVATLAAMSVAHYQLGAVKRATPLSAEERTLRKRICAQFRQILGQSPNDVGPILELVTAMHTLSLSVYSVNRNDENAICVAMTRATNRYVQIILDTKATKKDPASVMGTRPRFFPGTTLSNQAHAPFERALPNAFSPLDTFEVDLNSPYTDQVLRTGNYVVTGLSGMTNSIIETMAALNELGVNFDADEKNRIILAVLCTLVFIKGHAPHEVFEVVKMIENDLKHLPVNNSSLLETRMHLDARFSSAGLPNLMTTCLNQAVDSLHGTDRDLSYEEKNEMSAEAYRTKLPEYTSLIESSDSDDGLFMQSSNRVPSEAFLSTSRKPEEQDLASRGAKRHGRR